MKRVGLAVALLILACGAAHGKTLFSCAWDGTAAGTSLNAYGWDSPDFRSNTGYAWIDGSTLTAVSSAHRLQTILRTGGGPYYAPSIGYSAALPVTLTASVYTTNGSGGFCGVLTRGGTDSGYYGWGGFIRSSSGNMSLQICYSNQPNFGSYVSVSATPYMYPASDLIVIKIIDTGYSLAVFYTPGSVTPTTKQVEYFTTAGATHPEVRLGWSNSGLYSLFDNIVLQDADPEPTATPTPSATPTPGPGPRSWRWF